MIVCSKERYLPTIVNTLTLKSADGVYIYMHRDVYDKAVVLRDRYKLDEMDGFFKSHINDGVVDWFYRIAPSPLNVLAPFLNLIEEPIEEDFELCCGALHVITSAIDVRQFFKQGEGLRNEVSFSLSLKEEYEMGWESFFATALPYDGINYGAQISGTNQYITPVASRDEEDEDDDDADENGEYHDSITENEDGTVTIEDNTDPELLAMLMAPIDFGGSSKSDDDDDEDDEPTGDEETSGGDSEREQIRKIILHEE